MSVINQMLQDLEQRRTVTAGESPLGGVSASNISMRNIAPMNYIMLGAVLVLAVITAFLFGSQRFTTMPASLPTTEVSKVNEAPLRNDGATEVIVTSSADSLQSVKTEPAIREITVSKIEPSPTNTGPIPQTVPQTVTQMDRKIVAAKNITALNENVEKSVVATTNEVTNVEHTEEEIEAASPMVIDKRIRPLSIAQQAQQHFQQAVANLGRGQQGLAQDELTSALTIDPSHARARETLAALLLNTGRLSEAGATLRDGLRINPGETSLAKVYARILVDQGNLKESINVLERARPPVSRDPEYHALLAAFYQRAGKFGQAAQYYQQVLIVQPGVAQWWMGLGLSLESIDEPAKALSSYQRAQRLGGLNAEVKKFVTGRVNALTPTVARLTKNSESIGE